MKVTTLAMTYNHERFIGQALESALSQAVDFGYEILVSEDCSTDRTRAIVRDYQRRHPERIRLLLSERNLHSNEVVARGIRAARGTYVALLDGDDYWLTTDKLQKQADFLDHHPECTMCFHNARVVDEEGKVSCRLWTPAGQKAMSTLEDIWGGNVIATASAVFRRDALGEIPAWYLPLFPITDWPLYLLIAERGAIGYLDEVMSVYRLHRGGLYSARSEADRIEATGRLYRIMNANLNYRYDRIARAACARYYLEWAEEYERRGARARARACLVKSALGGGLRFPLPRRRFLRLAGRLCVPAPRSRLRQ